MSIKRMSLRIKLDKEGDRKAWELLQNLSGSKKKALISENKR